MSITDLHSLRLYLNLHPRDLLGLSSLHATRTRFQLVLVELIATLREYSALQVRYSLVPCSNWAPRSFDSAISNLTTLEVAWFLSDTGLSEVQADDAQDYWHQWLTQMARDFPHDNVDHQGILVRTYCPLQQLPRPLPRSQLWYPLCKATSKMRAYQATQRLGRSY